MNAPLTPGAKVEVIGRPVNVGLGATLADAMFRPLGKALPTTETSLGLPVLRLIQQVRALDPAAADQGYSVRLRASVTWSTAAGRQIYVMDYSGGVAVSLPANFGAAPAPGTPLDITGISRSGDFAPIVQAETVLARDGMVRPSERPTSLEQALSGSEESQVVTISGYVRSAERSGPWHRLLVATPTGEFTAVLPFTMLVDALPGAVVQFTGICRALTDSQRQLTGIEVLVAGSDGVKIEEPAPANAFDTPARTIASLRQFNLLTRFNHRVRVSGVVVHYNPGEFARVQDGAHALLVLSRQSTPLRPGDRIDIVGFPGRRGQRIVLRESVFQVTAHDQEPAASELDDPAVLHPELDGRLVRLSARLVAVSQRAHQVRLICESGNIVFDALADAGEAERLQSIRVGSHLALTGVYDLQFDQNAHARAFELQLRTHRDIRTLAAPPWLTAPRALTLMAVLIGIAAAGFGWVFSLHRRVDRQTGVIREQIEKSARLEAELVRSSKLESLGVLAGGIAHDFNNLLTVILGNISLVLHGDSPLGGEDQHCLRESERAGFRARDLTQQLLIFAKGGDPVRSAVSLPDVVREAAVFALHGSKVRSEFDFAADLAPAHVDRGQISQVVHNIVINAMQAMPGGGIVRLSLHNTPVTEAEALPIPPGPYLMLAIADSGTGIAPELRPRIFEPYFTTKKTGHGLGLATVYSIVKKHVGHIAVESTLGEGTTFRLWLPAADAPAPAAATTPAAPAPLQGRVLLMDDEASVRRIGGAMLRKLGLEVDEAAEGREAVRVFGAARGSGRPFALVILDLTVPGGMGGKDTAEALRQLDPAVRLIVSSGYSNDPIMASYREHGFQGCIPKPYGFEQFAREVSDVLATRRPPA
jgi:signal transduction histidine kinase/CheY-like chemotaxis protein